METETMGRVMVEATIENMEDLWAVKRGLLPADRVRKLVVPDALVDTGATLLSLPQRLIRQLGLDQVAKKRVTSSSGTTEAGMYEAVRLTIQGRQCTMDVMEVPDNVPVLIGHHPAHTHMRTFQALLLNRGLDALQVGLALEVQVNGPARRRRHQFEPRHRSADLPKNEALVACLSVMEATDRTGVANHTPVLFPSLVSMDVPQQERLHVGEKAVTQAEESLAITRDRFTQGAALAAQLIDAQTALTAARVRHADAGADVQIATAALRKALGLPILESPTASQ